MVEGHVWTERDRFDDDVVCDECGHINSETALDCQDCGTTLLDEDNDDEWIEDSVNDSPPRPAVANKQFNRNVIEGLYREGLVMKAGFEVVAKSIAVVSTILLALYGLYRIVAYFNVESVLILTIGVVSVFTMAIWGWGAEEADLGMFAE